MVDVNCTYLAAATHQGPVWPEPIFICIYTPARATFFCRAKRYDQNQNGSGVTDQSLTSVCLVTSRRCKLSAADEEWYSLKRPSSTVAVQKSNLYAEVSTILTSMAICFCKGHAHIYQACQPELYKHLEIEHLASLQS